jgi:hypothetical protein
VTIRYSTNRETWLVKLWIGNDRERIFIGGPNRQILNWAKDQAAAAWSKSLGVEEHNQAHFGIPTCWRRRSAAEWYEMADAMMQTPQNGPYAVHRHFGLHAATGHRRWALIDVSDVAQEAGFRLPVAMTAAAWSAAVEVPFNTPCQDETGRLWDVLNVLRFSVIGRVESQIDSTSPSSENMAFRAESI